MALHISRTVSDSVASHHCSFEHCGSIVVGVSNFPQTVFSDGHARELSAIDIFLSVDRGSIVCVDCHS